MKEIDYKYNEEEKRNCFCCKSKDVWGLAVSTNFSYDLADGEQPAFLERKDHFKNFNEIKRMLNNGFTLTDNAKQVFNNLDRLFQAEFDCVLAKSQLTLCESVKTRLMNELTLQEIVGCKV